MTCKTCGRTLEKEEKDYCPSCKNNNDKQQKSGMAKLGTFLSVAGLAVVGVIELINRKNS